jgi:hypothetical protein
LILAERGETLMGGRGRELLQGAGARRDASARPRYVA